MVEEKEVVKENTDIQKTGTESKTVTILGVGERIEGASCYVLGFITGLLFLVIERENKFVRFHALQSIATFLPLYMVMSAVERVISLSTISTVGFSISIFGLLISMMILSVIWTLIGVLWILLIYKASRGERYRLPIIGRIAERYA